MEIRFGFTLYFKVGDDAEVGVRVLKKEVLDDESEGKTFIFRLSRASAL